MAPEQRLIDANNLSVMIEETAQGLADCDQQNAAWALRKYAIRDITEAPTVDAVEVPDKELLRAIKLLIKQYEHSKNSEYVHSPVAHALFHTWKQVDERRTDP